MKSTAALKQILVAVQPSVMAECSLQRACQMARAHRASLCILHVQPEEMPPFFNAMPPEERQDIQDQLEQDSLQALKSLSQSWRQGIPDVSHLVRHGRAAEQILSVSHKISADLIVVGLNEQGWSKARFLGSTTDHVARHAKQPVLLTKRPGAPYQGVITAVDLSPASLVILQSSMDICPKAQHRVVHADNLPLVFEQTLIRSGTSKAELQDYQRIRLQNARSRLKAIIRDLPAPEGRRPGLKILQGDTEELLISLSRNGRVDLIAVGLRRQAALKEALLGSIARSLLRQAACDVLLIPYPSRSRTGSQRAG
ncbi:universal stress protein [Fodinicurvata sediminis]|uniref:universal stress protein n=1 Tax=Fodinicurvata sediminis TaxID=1121832 RepID=UPI0003B5EEE9|nr:universal stress protein [Fodinicurvata sediminis]